jgi:hypothetical protein
VLTTASAVATIVAVGWALAEQRPSGCSETQKAPRPAETKWGAMMTPMWIIEAEPACA